MGFIKDYAVPAIIGALISIFMDKIAVHYLKVALRSERMLESLEKKITTLNTVSENSLRMGEKCRGPYFCGWDAIRGWNLRLEKLVLEAHEMVKKHKGFSRLHHKLNIFSRYRRSKDIANLISNIDKHLKLFPVAQLHCVLLLIMGKRRLRLVLIGGGPGISSRDFTAGTVGWVIKAAFLPIVLAGGGPPIGDFTAGTVGWVITAAFLVIFLYMGRLLNFKKKLASFQDLMVKFEHYVKYLGKMIDRIGENDANRLDNWLTPASTWFAEFCTIVTEGQGIGDTWSPIASCRKSKQITELISRLDAHLNQLSWITLDLLLHETEGPTEPPILTVPTIQLLNRMAQRTLTTSSQETLAPRRPSTASRETEGAMSNAVPSSETRSTSNPTPPPQDVSIPIVQTAQGGYSEQVQLDNGDGIAVG